MKEGDFLPFALPDIGEDEISEVVNTLKSGWLTTGPKTKEFEASFADFIGMPQALAVNSATAGLHLALEAVGVGAGDKVVVPVYTFTATAEVVRYLGADPVFVDVDPDSLNIDVAAFAQVVVEHPEIKAVIPVDIAGQTPDLDEIIKIAHGAGIVVIEDAAHALPARYKGRMVGTISDITVYSFYATKTLAVGEGGMVVTRNQAWVDRIKTMRLHGISRDVFDRYTSEKPSWYYEVIAPGYKYNMTDIAASLGIHQLRKAMRFQEKREQIANYYNESLKNLPLRLPEVSVNCDLHAWHLYIVRIEDETLNRDDVINRLAKLGIGTSVHFIPLHCHPYWRDRYELKYEDFPVAYKAYQHAISLPIYTRMNDADMRRTVDAIVQVISSKAV